MFVCYSTSHFSNEWSCYKNVHTQWHTIVKIIVGVFLKQLLSRVIASNTRFGLLWLTRNHSFLFDMQQSTRGYCIGDYKHGYWFSQTYSASSIIVWLLEPFASYHVRREFYTLHIRTISTCRGFCTSVHSFQVCTSIHFVWKIMYTYLVTSVERNKEHYTYSKIMAFNTNNTTLITSLHTLWGYS